MGAETPGFALYGRFRIFWVRARFFCFCAYRGVQGLFGGFVIVGGYMGKKTYIGAMVTEEEKQSLLCAAKEMNVTLSEFIKRRVLVPVTAARGCPDHHADMLTVEQMASVLHVSVRKARMLCEEGRVTCVRIGKLYRITRASLEDYLAGERKKADDQAELMRPEEAASCLKISRSTMHRMIVSGEIPATRVANRYRIRREDVLVLLEKRTP